MPPGHPEGYQEGVATLYDDIAALIEGGIEGDAPVPGLEAGLEGMWFIDACLQSARAEGRWIMRG